MPFHYNLIGSKRPRNTRCYRQLDEWQSLRIRNFTQICFITTLLMYPLLTFNNSSATQKKKTVCSASICAPYQNRNHIRAAAIILVNQHHLMHLAAVFQIQMKHLCKSNRCLP